MSLNQVIFVANNVLDLLDVYEVYFAQGLASKVPLQADLILAMKISLHVMQTPRQELTWQAIVFAQSNFFHERVVDHIFIVYSIPDVILLRLHCTQYFKWVNVLIRLERCSLCSRIITEIYHRCLIRMLKGI